MADFGQSFAAPFRGHAWPGRVLVGAALELLPLVLAIPTALRFLRHGFQPSPRALALVLLPVLLVLACRSIQAGYLRRFARATLAGGEEGLPAWDRFDEDLIEGFKLLIVTLGLFLPAFASAAMLALVIAALGCSSLAWLPFVVVLPPALLITLFYLPAALLIAIAEGDLGAAFDFNRVAARIGCCLGSYALSFIVALAAIILAQLGLLLACVGVVATRFIAISIAVHAFASAYRQCLAPGGTAASS